MYYIPGNGLAVMEPRKTRVAVVVRVQQAMVVALRWPVLHQTLVRHRRTRPHPALCQT